MVIEMGKNNSFKYLKEPLDLTGRLFSIYEN
jgi:hypothetical protein